MIASVKSKKRRVSPVRIDSVKYGKLLAAVLPAVIRSDGDYERVNTEIVKLLKKGGQITQEEERLLDLLTTLVEKYDDEHYRIPDAPPHAIIRTLMADRSLRHRDLVPVLGSSGVTSEVINGKRKPSKAQVKALAEFFKIPPEVFVSLD